MRVPGEDGPLLGEAGFELSLEGGFGVGVEKTGSMRGDAAASAAPGPLPARRPAPVSARHRTFGASTPSSAGKVAARLEHA